ncbi:MAG: 16S rRNA (cytosine(967)-C(5))-methyltransferase [Candidatus Rokubacteria bacterium RIFCSPLOWO2_02_FULL_68_19]|nr:MAG: 16S rRNA (cytosine(967)-C(5))-methyltransferase [Candidatus Rokubacteria bacterium RIFCSPLOWO2_02_FULL_68_19]
MSSARVEALRILCRVEEDRAFADLALEAALERAKLPARDRALTTEIVYGTLRWQRRLDWILAPHSRRRLDRLDPWVRNLLRLTAYQLQFLSKVPAYAAVNDAGALAKRRAHGEVAPFLNAVLRSLTRSGGSLPPPPEDRAEDLATRLSFPSWLAHRWAQRFGLDEAERLMTALDERPEVTIRANLLKCTRAQLAQRLSEEEEVACSATIFAPEGLALEEPGPAFRFKAFKEGWFTVQDEASILVGHLLGPKPGETVADVCAAPGTKATHLAALMRNSGKVVAMDPHAARLKLVSQAAARLGVTIVECHGGSAEALAPRFKDRFDRVLVDAPCSNLGVVRRHPDVKWRRTEADLPRLAERQRAILDAAASMCRAGGTLVFATCSLEPEENEGIVLPFLEAHADWRLDPPAEAEFPIPFEPPGVLRCLPHKHGTDGFTAFRLTRTGNPPTLHT